MFCSLNCFVNSILVYPRYSSVLWPIWRPKVLFSFLCRAKISWHSQKTLQCSMWEEKKMDRERDSRRNRQPNKTGLLSSAANMSLLLVQPLEAQQTTNRSVWWPIPEGQISPFITVPVLENSNHWLISDLSIMHPWRLFGHSIGPFLNLKRTDTRLSTNDEVFLAVWSSMGLDLML